MRYSAARGTRDIKESEVAAFHELEKAARDVFRRYGYEEIRTPVFETAELFQRAVGEATDIVEKEMYVFEDRGGRKLALRPEGTAGVVRAYLEHGWDKTGGLRKLFYSGPMFRADRPQAGRYREFWQIGAEYFGNPSAQADADMLWLVKDLLEAYGLKDVKFQLNSIGCPKCRPQYRETLVKFLEGKKASLCEDCQRRLEKNPLRALDCKVDGPKLADAPKIADHLCDECRAHDKELKELLNAPGLKFDYAENPWLVRGLDYYSRTVFEVTASGLGSQDAVAAGGRYDALVKTLGGPDVPAVGFALGMDRVARARYGEAGAPLGGDADRRVFVALAGAGTGPTGYEFVRRLRAAGFTAEVGASDKSLKAQLRWADAWNARWVVLIGEDELKRGSAQLKDLKGHTQAEVSFDDLKSRIEKDQLARSS
jgi:histidyl-tRNA synthetase